MRRSWETLAICWRGVFLPPVGRRLGVAQVQQLVHGQEELLRRPVGALQGDPRLGLPFFHMLQLVLGLFQIAFQGIKSEGEAQADQRQDDHQNMQVPRLLSLMIG